MKKRRIMAMALAVTMLTSSVSFHTYAGETDVDAAVVDETVSGAAAVSSDDVDVTSTQTETAVAQPETVDINDIDISAFAKENYVGGLYTNVDLENGEWKASVFGSAGGQPKVGGYEFTSMEKDENGAPPPYFIVSEDGEGADKTVRVNMGVFDAEGSVPASDTGYAAGKVSSSCDGLVYYYKELDANTNFELTGTITVNRLFNENNQVSFGAMIRDHVRPMSSPEVYQQYQALQAERAVNADKANELSGQAKEYKVMARDKTGQYTDAEKEEFKQKAADLEAEAEVYSNKAEELNNQANALFVYDGDDYNKHYIAAGPLFLKNFTNTNNTTIKAFYRNDDGAISANDTGAAVYNPLLKFEGSTKPAAGQEYKVTIKKQGDLYSTQFGDLEPVVIDAVKLGDEGKLYAGFYAVRNADITVSDFSITETKEADSIEILTPPDKTTYIVSKTAAALDTTGLTAKVTYKDGTTETVGADKLVCSNPDLTKTGIKTVDVNYGGATASFDVDVDYNRVTDMKLNYEPFALDFLVGSKFNAVGLEIEASYKDGTSEQLKTDQYEIYIDDKLIDSNYYFTADDIGEHTVTAAYKTTDDVLGDGKSVSYKINVNPAALTSLSVRSLPAKGTESEPFDVNETFDPAGLIINANYDVDGQLSSKALDEDDYEITAISDGITVEEDGSLVFNTEGEKTLKVTYVNDPSKTCTFKVYVVAKKPTQATILTYPRQTYYVGEAFDESGLSVGVNYSNGDILTVEEAGFDWDLDLSKFDSSKANSADNLSYVKIIVHMGEVDSTITLPIRIVDNEDKYWKATLMGASSLGVSEADPSSNITVYDENGESALYMTGDSGNIVKDPYVGIMTDGKMTNVSKVNVRSWDGSGKYATDHDGIAYYYTRVNANNNYTVSADVTVNGYIRDPENPDDNALIAKKKSEMQAVYDKYSIKDENGDRKVITDLEALDMVRSGQEAFGIMARDVIPLYLPYAEGGDDNNITTNANTAKKDKYGEPMTVFEAYKQQEAGVLKDGSNITKEDINIISFSSNVVVAGGATSSTFPTNPTVSSFKEKAVQNRITLSYRSGVVSTDGAGSNTKLGFKTTTDHLPVKGDKYNITLKRINYGFSLTTYDYQTGTTETVYSFDTRENISDLLTSQDDKNVYVGFFACRFADIDVENITLQETDANVDAVINDLEEDVYSPKISVESDLYTENTNYSLILKASNPNGGLVTIKMNGEVIAEDEQVYKRNTVFPVTLPADSQNEFVFIYTPSKLDLCYDYDKVVTRTVITCKAIDRSMKDLYVAPDGKVNNAGTRENPIDLETAIGLVRPGQRIVMLDGTYTTRDTINISKSASGYAANKKYLVADKGANPVVDLQKKEAGFIISADYWEFEGFTVINSGGNCKPFHIGGNHNLVRNCTFHDNGDCGLQISRTSGGNNFEDWPADNLVINCEAYNNCDPSKNNADGFAVKLTVGNNNVFEDCVSHHNLDDGWDLYTKLSSGAIGEVSVENCISYRQGFELLADGSDKDYGATSGGNGFKAGGESIPVMHYFKDCKAFNNKGNGYDSNSNPNGKLRNVVFYNNQYSNIALYSSKRSLFSYDLKGVVSYRDDKAVITNSTVADRVGSLTEYTNFTNGSGDLSKESSNYFIWEKPSKDAITDSYNNEGVVVTADFFKSVNESDSIDEFQRYARDPETGEFIHGNFLALSTPYVHDSEDLITFPDTGYSSDETATEATTASSGNGGNSGGSGGNSGGSGSKSSGGGGGGGGTSARLTTTETTEANTEETTKSVVEPDTEATTEAPAANENSFDDIADKPWAVEAINALAEAGIINGVGDRMFAPDFSCKRADFAIMLVNVLGIEGTASDNFDDVSPDKYYYNYVGLAKEAGIVSGYGDGNFGPENLCTREELMVMVANAIKAGGIDITADVSVLDKFSDAADIADWAKPYVAYLVSEEIVIGSNGMINPKSDITRAEVAVIMYKLFNK